MSPLSRTSKKILVVLGATGTQGSSVINTFLSDSELAAQWHLRGITRNVTSEASQALTARGIEMVSADLSSPDSLTAAFIRAHAIFAITDFWAVPANPNAKMLATEAGFSSVPLYAVHVEESYGRNIALAASGASVLESLERFIFSSLPPIEQLTNGKFTHLKHFDGKANIVVHIRHNHPELWLRTSQIMIGHYNNNHLPGHAFAPSWNKDAHRYEIISSLKGDDLLPYIDTAATAGPFVKALLLAEPIGTIALAYDEMRSRNEFCQLLTRALGKNVVHVIKTDKEIAEDMIGGELGWEIAQSGSWASECGFFGEKIKGGKAWLSRQEDMDRIGWVESVTFPKDLRDGRPRVNSLEEYVRKTDWSELMKTSE